MSPIRTQPNSTCTKALSREMNVYAASGVVEKVEK